MTARSSHGRACVAAHFANFHEPADGRARILSRRRRLANLDWPIRHPGFLLMRILILVAFTALMAGATVTVLVLVLVSVRALAVALVAGVR